MKFFRFTETNNECQLLKYSLILNYSNSVKGLIDPLDCQNELIKVHRCFCIVEPGFSELLFSWFAYFHISTHLAHNNGFHSLVLCQTKLLQAQLELMLG